MTVGFMRSRGLFLRSRRRSSQQREPCLYSSRGGVPATRCLMGALQAALRDPRSTAILDCRGCRGNRVSAAPKRTPHAICISAFCCCISRRGCCCSGGGLGPHRRLTRGSSDVAVTLPRWCDHGWPGVSAHTHFSPACVRVLLLHCHSVLVRVLGGRCPPPPPRMNPPSPPPWPPSPSVGLASPRRPSVTVEVSEHRTSNTSALEASLHGQGQRADGRQLSASSSIRYAVSSPGSGSDRSPSPKWRRGGGGKYDWSLNHRCLGLYDEAERMVEVVFWRFDPIM